jgi:hypothetical protein
MRRPQPSQPRRKSTIRFGCAIDAFPRRLRTVIDQIGVLASRPIKRTNASWVRSSAELGIAGEHPGRALIVDHRALKDLLDEEDIERGLRGRA